MEVVQTDCEQLALVSQYQGIFYSFIANIFIMVNFFNEHHPCVKDVII